METLNVKTGSRIEIVDITQDVRRLVKENQWQDGIVLVYSP